MHVAGAPFGTAGIAGDEGGGALRTGSLPAAVRVCPPALVAATLTADMSTGRPAANSFSERRFKRVAALGANLCKQARKVNRCNRTPAYIGARGGHRSARTLSHKVPAANSAIAGSGFTQSGILDFHQNWSRGFFGHFAIFGQNFRPPQKKCANADPSGVNPFGLSETMAPRGSLCRAVLELCRSLRA